MAECGKKDTCKNYDKKCSECWSNSSIYDTHPCYMSKDLVEVVRCKDCIRNRGIGCPFWDEAPYNKNDFCSYGTPKERGEAE